MFKAKTEKKKEEKVSEEAMERNMAEFANAEAYLKKLTTGMENDIQSIRAEYADEIRQYEELRNQAFEVVHQYAKENRSTLFDKAKSVKHTYGVFGFRAGRERLDFDQDKIEQITNRALANLPMYVKTTVALDKTRLLADRDNKDVQRFLKQNNITVERDETFYINTK